jgi:hypothetical protein
MRNITAGRCRKWRGLQIGRSTLYRTLETLDMSERGEAGGELVASERQPRKIA